MSKMKLLISWSHETWIKVGTWHRRGLHFKICATHRILGTLHCVIWILHSKVIIVYLWLYANVKSIFHNTRVHVLPAKNFWEKFYRNKFLSKVSIKSIQQQNVSSKKQLTSHKELFTTHHRQLVWFGFALFSCWVHLNITF